MSTDLGRDWLVSSSSHPPACVGQSNMSIIIIQGSLSRCLLFTLFPKWWASSDRFNSLIHNHRAYSLELCLGSRIRWHQHANVSWIRSKRSSWSKNYWEQGCNSVQFYAEMMIVLARKQVCHKVSKTNVMAFAVSFELYRTYHAISISLLMMKNIKL